MKNRGGIFALVISGRSFSNKGNIVLSLINGKQITHAYTIQSYLWEEIPF